MSGKVCLNICVLNCTSQDLYKTVLFYSYALVPSDMILIYGKIAQFLLPLLGSDVHNEDIQVEVVPYHNYRSNKKVKNVNKPLVNVTPIKKSNKNKPVAVILAEQKYFKGENNGSSEESVETVHKIDDVVVKRKFEPPHWKSEEDKSGEGDISESSSESSIIIHFKRNKLAKDGLDVNNFKPIRHETTATAAEENTSEYEREGKHHDKDSKKSVNLGEEHKSGHRIGNSSEAKNIEEAVHESFKHDKHIRSGKPDDKKHKSDLNQRKSEESESTEKADRDHKHDAHDDKRDDHVQKLKGGISRYFSVMGKDNNFNEKHENPKDSQEKITVLLKIDDESKEDQNLKIYSKSESFEESNTNDDTNNKQKYGQDNQNEHKHQEDNDLPYSQSSVSPSYSNEDVGKYEQDYNDHKSAHHKHEESNEGTGGEKHDDLDPEEKSFNEDFEYIPVSETNEDNFKTNYKLQRISPESSSSEANNEKYNVKRKQYHNKSAEKPSSEKLESENEPDVKYGDNEYSHGKNVENFDELSPTEESEEVMHNSHLKIDLHREDFDSSSNEDILIKTNDLAGLHNISKSHNDDKNYHHNESKNQEEVFSGEEISGTKHMHNMLNEPHKNHDENDNSKSHSVSIEDFKPMEVISKVNGNVGEIDYSHIEHYQPNNKIDEDAKISTESSISAGNDQSHFHHEDNSAAKTSLHYESIENAEPEKYHNVFDSDDNYVSIVHYVDDDSKSVNEYEIGSKTIDNSDDLKHEEYHTEKITSAATDFTERSADLKNIIKDMVAEKGIEASNETAIVTEASTEADNVVPSIVFLKSGKVVKFAAIRESSEDSKTNNSNEVTNSDQITAVISKDREKPAKESDKKEENGVEDDIVIADVRIRRECSDENRHKIGKYLNCPKNKKHINEIGKNQSRDAIRTHVISEVKHIENDIADAIASYVKKKVYKEVRKQDSPKSYNLSFLFNRR